MDQTSNDTRNETRIDLGDDLLEKTAILNAPDNISNREIDPVLKSLNIKAVTLENLDDILTSAKILQGENLFEDAKKLLHQILILSPDHPEAKKLLNEIHDTELQQIFGKSTPPPSRPPINSDHFDPDVLIHHLDQDLGLGIFNETKIQLNQFSLIQNPEELNAYCDQLEQDLGQSPAQDWIDLGIGFLEIDLYSVASRLFAGA